MKTRIQGVTLIELMVALTVLGVLIGLAVPSFREMTSNSRVTAATNDLVTSLTLARSEALRRSTVTRVCATADQATCSGAVDWAAGWLVFVDTDNDGDVGANELIQAYPGVDAGLALVGTEDRISYNALGMGQILGANVTFSITPAYCTGNRVGQTVVSVIGTAQSSKVACP